MRPTIQCLVRVVLLIDRRIYAGEAVIITRNGGISRRQVAPPATFAPDIFEFVYFARPDSVIDGISVYRSRMAMGDALAEKVQMVLKEANIEVDVVIPVRFFDVELKVISFNAWTFSDWISIGTGYFTRCCAESRTKAAPAIP